MANQNADIKHLTYVRKIVAPQKENGGTGEKILEPEGYDGATIKEGSLWFIQKDRD